MRALHVRPEEGLVTIDFGRPFAYIFEDKDWVSKLLIAGLYAIGGLFCGIGIFALMGYQKRIAQAVGSGQDVPLPEIGFDRIGEDIVEGLKIFAIYLVYLLPSIMIQMCAGVANGILSGQGGDARDVGAIISIASMCLYLPLQLIGTFLAPAGIVRFADQNSLGAAFQLGAVFGFAKKYVVNLLLVFVIGIASQFIASFSLILLCIGIFWGIAFASMVNAHAWGQLLRIGRQDNALVST